MKIKIKRFNRQEYRDPECFESRNLNYAFCTEYQETAIYLKQVNPVLPDKIQNSVGKNLNTAFVNAANNKDEVQDRLQYGQNMCSFYKSIQAKQFSVYVCYPGLLVGTGYPHGTKQVKGEIQMGASFDWVTGAPYYPGSSVKGVLRSLFKVASGDNTAADGCRAELLERINNAAPGAFSSFTKDEALYLKNVLFGKDPEDESKLPEHGRCIFYDAHVVGFRKKASGQQEKIFGMDSLAPHEDRLGNPVPINMLRILPDVCLTFNMVLHDVPDKDGNILITSDQLLTLFKEIILDLGIGAKTNTGYGIVKEIEEPNIYFTSPRIKAVQSGTGKAYDSYEKDISLKPQSNHQNLRHGPSCPKCGAAIIMNSDGFIKCKGNCGMVYGIAFGEALSFEETKQLLSGHEVRTLRGKLLSVDLNDSYEPFTTKTGKTKYRLKYRKLNRKNR